MISPRLLAGVLLGFAGAVPALAHETAVVLGSDLAPYREALEGFKDAYGKPVETLTLGGKPPRSVKVVVAFGGKAALQRYPAGVILVYGLAPGVRVGPDTHAGATTRIPMDPAPEALLRHLLALQPGLKRLAVLWSSAGGAETAELLKKAGAGLNVALVLEPLESGDDLPGALRRLKGGADALWLPPDPLVLNARNFEIVKGFAYDNDIPFYVPTEALAERGAVAGISVSYAEAGRAAARATQDALAGKPVPEAFVQSVSLSVNRAAAAECGLTPPAAVLKTAGKVYP